MIYITHVGQRFIHNGGAEIFLKDLSRCMKNEIQFKQSICTNVNFYEKEFCDTFPHPVFVGGEKEISNAITNDDVIICWGESNLNSMNLPTPKNCIFNACADVRYQLELCDKYVNHVIACSTRTATTVCFDKPHTVILPGINTKRLVSKENRIEKRRSVGVKDHEFLIGMIARIEKDKQQFLLIEAVEQLQDENIKAIFIGDGPDMELLKSKNSPNCLFVGHHEDVGDWWNILDCYCLLSSREGCPASLFESMFCKIPIISTLVGSAGDLLNEHNSIIVDGIKSLMEAIIKIKNNNNTLMTQLAFERFLQNGLIENTAKSWIKLIKRLRCTKKIHI